MDLLDKLRLCPENKSSVLYENLFKNEIDRNILIKILSEFKPVIIGKENNETMSKIIYCDNSYERRIVHKLSDLFNLYHARHGEWDDSYERTFDWECRCRYCWEEAGRLYYRINGVLISTHPVPMSRKDISHQNKERRLRERLIINSHI